MTNPARAQVSRRQVLSGIGAVGGMMAALGFCPRGLAFYLHTDHAPKVTV